MSRRTKADGRTQEQQVLQHLESKGSITHMEALINYGITRLAARIGTLRENGWMIDTVVNKDERGSNYARYYPRLRLNRSAINRYNGDARGFCFHYLTSPLPAANVVGCVGWRD